MKITKTSERAYQLKKAKEKANKGCKSCPCCGTPYIGIPLVKSWVKGFFKMEHYEVQCYHCQYCGAEWESDPYLTR